MTNNKAMNLVAVWSQNNKEDPRRRYIGEVWQSLNYYKNMFNSPTIIAGDFNWNVIWDKEHSNYPLHGTFDGQFVFDWYYILGIICSYYGGKRSKTTIH